MRLAAEESVGTSASDGTCSAAKDAAPTLKKLVADGSGVGPTTVSAGKLSITGTMPTTTGITVASGATFGGTGTTNGTVTVNGTLQPGTDSTAGTLTAGTSSNNAQSP